ncbi:Quinohemoprotein alcohol dehydrogenase ADH IIB precursor [Anatilimnocola aggregata]|uniref:Quinohemoprotein alcohol dehydrogenase ADH IIB n=1 Tax=Anatilimnocola aggregata TaxID=2528021 RepID=A0A517Y830_9BACT|nr:PQQ-binding-like beta-propeller repeat protein [Anatilimnocola aggregata]QDU26365.1 Quinohemoprotein alcohol dehydrogenase ADH IIB precursor [Anatilimnocola aggregata]
MRWLLPLVCLAGCGTSVSVPSASVAQSPAVPTTFVAASAPAKDWPQWMGPQRNDVWDETGIVEKFPESGLPVVWRTKIGGGYAGPAVVGDRVYVMDYQRKEGALQNDPGTRNELKGTERVLCLSANDGSLLWKHEYECPYAISYANGPRCTPTVHGDKVYTLGAEGNLFCLEAATGKVVWSKEFKVDYQAPTPIWGFTSHPLVDGNKLFCLVGGPGSTVVAFDKDSGKELWKALSAPDAGYCPPTMITAGGTKQLLIWHPESLNSLNPENGDVYWSEPLAPQYGMSVAAPVKSGDYLYASSIGDIGGVWKLDQTKPAVQEVWIGDNKTAVYVCNSTVHVDKGVVFGSDCRGGQFRAVDLETGKRLWETFKPTTGDRRASHGTAFVVKNGEKFFLFSETGDLILANLNREAYEEISRFHVLKPTSEAFGREVVWSHPAFANRSVYARNDEEIVCVSLAK